MGARGRRSAAEAGRAARAGTAPHGHPCRGDGPLGRQQRRGQWVPGGEG